MVTQGTVLCVDKNKQDNTGDGSLEINTGDGSMIDG